MKYGRFRVERLLVVCVVLMWSGFARSDEAAVPLQLQVELSVKVVEYAQEPLLQSMDVVRIGILTKTRSVESAQFAGELKAAFVRVSSIAGRPHEQVMLEWAGQRRLLEDVKGRRLTILYLTPGLDDEIPEIAQALGGTRVITIGAVDGYVKRGALLGFELVSGHPKMIFNVKQARRHEVVLRSAVMRLMRIVE